MSVHVAGAVHVPQLPPQPSSPQLLLGRQFGVQHVPAVQMSPVGHVPQSIVPLQPSEAVPQFCPAGHDVAGVQQAPAGLLPGGLLLTHSPLCPFVPQQL